MSSLVRLQPVAAPPPSLNDNTADLDRLLRALRHDLGAEEERLLSVPHRHVPRVAECFRACGFGGVAVLNEDQGRLEPVDLLPAAPLRLPAMALDLGTTHLEAVLLDLLSGQELARTTRVNSQISHGDDILTRIHFATGGRGKEGCLEVLQQAVLGDTNALARELAALAGCAVTDIRALSVAGNSAMAHLFLGLNPYHLCREPYIPLVNAPGPVAAVELGLKLHAAAPVHVLPGVGAYFGGDLLAGIVASDLDLAEKPEMLIDVGTNAEVVVGCRDWLVACAGAAGPALEGGVAKMGMRAGTGVIERVDIDPASGRLAFRVIGAAAGEGAAAAPKARGICGSGMIDLLAALFQAEMIDIRGKLRSEKLGDRLLAGPDGPAFIVAQAEETVDGQPVTVSQIDLDALMRSKAAMYAILGTLMDQVGLPFAALERIHVAGAFGRHIDPRRAVIMGMIPDLPLSTYRPLGNSSLAGAGRYLLEGEARRRIGEVARKITYIELNVNHEFMIRFSGSRFIPHTDRALFPSVPYQLTENR